ncbi:MAG TPA: heme o synthase [Caulobacteraceae bacterium]|jgi:protoheme IX farnesyltransferase|nr:heme o synthase [Caulobacteraceae bacterium]
MTTTAQLAVHRPATWRDFVTLMKPRVMSLVMLTAVTGLICARSTINPVLAGVAILCIALGAGGSAALNMGYDADIDALMRRTRSRPVPSGRVQRSDALALGVILSLFSVAVMGLATNLLAAGLLAFTIAFYAIVYTRLLKRRTAQNIVIGGLAGALPPAVGWAAASGTAPLPAWVLVAIIFVWTPPHFWALSLYTSEDYARAGVPMMPLTAGPASTRRQILAYSLVLAPLGLAPAFVGLGGLAYAGVAAAGGAVFVILAARLAMSRAGESGEARQADGLYAVRAGAKAARNLFAFSIVYLFVLFACLLGEHLLGAAPLANLIG